MRLRSTTISILAAGLLTGSAVGVAAQDDAAAPEAGGACAADLAVAADTIAAGSHCTDVLGPAVTFETSHDWVVPLQVPGTFIVADPEAQGPVQAVLLMRGRLADGATDPATWFAAQDGVEVLESGQTEIDGLEATVFDVTADVPSDLQFLRVAPPVEVIVLRAGEYYRIWWAQPDDGDALIGFAPVVPGDEAWLERADEIVDSLAIAGDLSGSVAVAEPSVGPFTKADFTLGTLSMELPEPTDILDIQPGFMLAQLAGRQAGVVFIAPQATEDGVPLTDAAAMRAAWEAGTPLSDGPTATILGQEIVGAIAEDPTSLPNLVLDPEAEDPFVLTPSEGFGVDYAVDTDAGPMLVGVFATDDADVEDAVAYFDALVGTITLE